MAIISRFLKYRIYGNDQNTPKMKLTDKLALNVGFPQSLVFLCSWNSSIKWNTKWQVPQTSTSMQATSSWAPVTKQNAFYLLSYANKLWQLSLFNDMISSSHYRSSHDRTAINNELYRRKQSWCNLMNYTVTFLEQLRKTKRKTMARVTSVPTKIQN